MVVIGGEGSAKGAKELAKASKIKIVCLPKELNNPNPYQRLLINGLNLLSLDSDPSLLKSIDQYFSFLRNFWINLQEFY